MSKKIVIIGAGPTGLGAAWRLQEQGNLSWELYEQRGWAGGLAASYLDSKGFTWDFGGHVQFSHYTYFDNLMKKLLGTGWYTLERESWVWIADRFVPYPFQNNIRLLPPDELLRCLNGLIDVSQKKLPRPKNFEDWINSSFGEGIAQLFMLPYNYKVWAHHPKQMQYKWIGERVATVDLKRILGNIVFNRDDVSWGPNNTFMFPKHGGTGQIWKTLASRLPQKKMHYNKEIQTVSLKKKELCFTDGTRARFDRLISTMPLDQFLKRSDFTNGKVIARRFHYSTVHVIGIGLKGKKPDHINTKCWMYFPESDSPFYRATVFSNYSPANVPNSRQYWSLMLEVSESPYKTVDRSRLIPDVIKGLQSSKLIADNTNIVSTWIRTEDHGYPTPWLRRDAVVDPVLRQLEKRGVLSRGRFGAWKYEVSNQDHSLMQGVEAVDHILTSKPEKTLWHPSIVNAKKQ